MANKLTFHISFDLLSKMRRVYAPAISLGQFDIYASMYAAISNREEDYKMKAAYHLIEYVAGSVINLQRKQDVTCIYSKGTIKVNQKLGNTVNKISIVCGDQPICIPLIMAPYCNLTNLEITSDLPFVVYHIIFGAEITKTLSRLFDCNKIDTLTDLFRPSPFFNYEYYTAQDKFILDHENFKRREDVHKDPNYFFNKTIVDENDDIFKFKRIKINTATKIYFGLSK